MSSMDSAFAHVSPSENRPPKDTSKATWSFMKAISTGPMFTHLASGAGAIANTPMKTAPAGISSIPHQGCIGRRRAESAGVKSLAVVSFRAESAGTESVGDGGIWADAGGHRDEAETAMLRAT